MRITFRLIVSLVVVVAVVAATSAWIHVGQDRAQRQDEIERRSRLLALTLQEVVQPLVSEETSERLRGIVEKYANRERLAGVAVYDREGRLLAATAALSGVFAEPPAAVREALSRSVDGSAFVEMGGKEVHLYALPLTDGGGVAHALLIVHDASFIQAQLRQIWLHAFVRVLAQSALITLVTLLVIRWSVFGPIARMAEWMRALRSEGEVRPPEVPKGDLFAPIAREVTTFARHLSAAKAAAEREAGRPRKDEPAGTPEWLKEHVRARLGDKPLFVVSNREPYMHLRRGRDVEVIVPAGGLVTALEPVLRACGGTWIAHGAGDADFEVTDGKGRLQVPPGDPRYTLRRVPLSKEEEQGYYYGFSNEGLWPLCHLAHTRPIFRADDWAQYQRVSEKFATAVLEEVEGLEDPFVLIQDYHFALLPRLLKERRPEIRAALFWHIPWPNPEAFGICPWQRELLQGMLGADLVGFQTQSHCNNVLDTVDAALEARVDWERFGVSKEGHLTLVKPFPISVAFPPVARDPYPTPPRAKDRDTLLKELGVRARFLGVGVDRLDYTKGVLERFRAIERFLEKHPRYQGEFVFVQIGAPSRTYIKRYHDFLAEVEAEAQRINWRFKRKDWRPIVYLEKHHSHEEILPYYLAADLCMITSLHDGMNLVAKEFVASREDGEGVLVLSQFAGASRELRDALIVNPYNAEQGAEAIRYALEMDPEERRARMKAMRETLRENNVYRWAGSLIEELSRLRLREPTPAGSE